METYIRTAHEEQITQGQEHKFVGVLVNLSNQKTDWKDSLIYVFTGNVYIFFETIYDMVTYLFYGDKEKIKRAYLEDDEFDSYLSAEYIGGPFTGVLEWVND